MGGAALAALTPIVFSFFLKLLEEQNITITDQQKEALKTGLVAAGPVGWGLLSLDKLRDLDLDLDVFKGWKFGGLG